jgi:hypothetical protein
MSTEEAVQQELFEAATSPEPVSETPTESTTPEAPSPPEPAVSRPSGPDQSDSIPSWRLREEAEARRQAEDRARTLEERYNQAMAHWRQNQPQPKAPDFYADPQAYIEAAIQQNLQQRLQPVQAEYHRAIQQLARGQAESVHGAEAVALAEQVFMEARDRRMLDPMDYERVVRSPNRFDACVQWYKRLYSLHTVGDDPEAWWQKRHEEKLADPKFQAEVMERLRGIAATRPGMTRLPPSLSRSTAAASNGAGTGGDLSHESLWASATK